MCKAYTVRTVVPASVRIARFGGFAMPLCWLVSVVGARPDRGRDGGLVAGVTALPMSRGGPGWGLVAGVTALPTSRG